MLEASSTQLQAVRCCSLGLHHMPQAMKSLVKPKAGPDVIKHRNRQLVGQLDYDIVVCGGTLGLLLALSLQVCPVPANLVPWSSHLETVHLAWPCLLKLLPFLRV